MIRFRNSNYQWVDFNVAVLTDLLSHPARLRVIRYLLDHEHGTKELFVKINRLNANLMQEHLEELLNGEFLLLSGNSADGIYTLNQEKWAYCRKILSDFLNYGSRRTDQQEQD
ncbi:MAG: hypothetical protein H6606_04410 [Flavobacteriales bacterium]|nr:hypothetical protein [Flavobacteriales bacterium]